MDLFDNGKPEELLLLTRNLIMTLEASGMILTDAKIKYLHTMVRGEELRQFDTLSAEVGSTTLENLTSISLGLGTHFLPVNALSRQNCAMRRGTRKTCGLKVRCYADHLIDINEYLDVFPGENPSDLFW